MEDSQIVQSGIFPTGQFGVYRLLSLLGEGDNTRVYVSEQTEQNRRVALKIWGAQIGREDQERFQAEAGRIRSLQHPGILPIWESGVQAGLPFLASAYAPGGSLRQRLPRGTRARLQTLLPWVRQISAALHAAHQQGILHRNLKPENLLIGSRGEILIGDFSLAPGAQSFRTQRMDALAPYVNYMAPELLQGRPGPQSDEYSLAMMLYEWLSGILPFQGTYMEVARRQMEVVPPTLPTSFAPPELALVLSTALAKDPARRFSSLPAFARAFEQAGQHVMPSTPAEMPRAEPSATPLETRPGPTEKDPSQTLILRPGDKGPESSTLHTSKPDLSPLTQDVSAIPTSQPHAALSGQDVSAIPTSQPHLAQNIGVFPPFGTVSTRSDRYQTIPAHQEQPQSGSNLPPLTPPTPPRARPPQPDRQQRRGWRLLLIILVCCLALAELGLMVNLRILQPARINQSHLQATQVGENATQTAAKATRVAVYATQTATTQQSPAYLYASLAGRKPLLDEAPTGSDRKFWISSSPKNTGCNFQPGGLETQSAGSSNGYYFFCAYANPLTAHLQNFAYQADLTILRGSDAGLTFRNNKSAGSNEQTFYLYTIGSNGTYGLAVVQNGIKFLWYHTDTAIKKGAGQQNHLTVIAYQSWLYLFVNGHYLTGMQDKASAAGTIGTVVFSSATVTQALFSHLTIWTL